MILIGNNILNFFLKQILDSLKKNISIFLLLEKKNIIRKTYYELVLLAQNCTQNVLLVIYSIPKFLLKFARSTRAPGVGPCKTK